MSEAMTAIYGAIGELMAGCIKELRGSNKIDTSQLTLENGLFKAFDDIVRRQLDAVWHTVSFRTKQVGNASNHQTCWCFEADLQEGCIDGVGVLPCALSMTHLKLKLLLHYA